MRRLRSKLPPSIPISSMGDIAFLLIIFFMISSNFIKEASVELKPPRAADLEPIKESPIAVAIDENGMFYIQGNQVPDSEAIEWGVRALVADKETQEGRTVMFRCDQSIQREIFEPVIDSIAKGGGLIAAMGDLAHSDSN